MKSSTALNHYERLRSKLIDVYSSAESFSLSADQLNEIVARGLHCDTAWPKVPSWVRERLYELNRVLFDNLYRYHLKWVTLEWEGVQYYDWDSIPEAGKEYLKTHSHEEASEYQYHAWKRTGKRFSMRLEVK